MMLTFILRLLATQVIKKNFDFIQTKVKKGSKFLYNRLYTKKKEIEYPDLNIELRVRSNSF